ncbi:MAG: DUF2058 domain-containing protein [Pseudomonadales bacterium]|nr:DUF2058 domain-containing protein [Pseudomonadales bacterium]
MAKKKKGSLADQLRSVGLVTDKQVRKAKKVQHRKDVRVRQGLETDDNLNAAQEAQVKKAASDLAKNKLRDSAAETKSLAAQIKQLIDLNSKREAGETTYNFTQNNKIKKIYISEQNKKQLNKGYLAIVATEEGFNLVPEKVAMKIRERDESIVLYLYDRSKDVIDEDDPYKDFQIPDNLEW